MKVGDIFADKDSRGKETALYINTSAPCRAPRFTPHALPSLSSPHICHCRFFPRYPSVSHDIPRHPSTSLGAPPCRVTYSNKGGERTESFSWGNAVLAHGGDGSRLSKSQAPWVFAAEGHPVVILETGQDGTWDAGEVSTTTATITKNNYLHHQNYGTPSPSLRKP